jgi:prepilin-type N-terminal cleavage/methylation domain-containing protein
MQTRLVKKGFSLIEIMMVLLLLGILIVAFKPAFQPKNQNELYGQSCVNMIHGELVNFLNSAMTSKNLFSGNTSISAERYTITVNEITDTITL